MRTLSNRYAAVIGAWSKAWRRQDNSDFDLLARFRKETGGTKTAPYWGSLIRKNRHTYTPIHNLSDAFNSHHKAKILVCRKDWNRTRKAQRKDHRCECASQLARCVAHFKDGACCRVSSA